MMNIGPVREDYEDTLDILLRAHEKMIVAQINASMCRTSFDWDKANDAEKAFEQARESAVQRMIQVTEAERQWAIAECNAAHNKENGDKT